MMKITHQVQIYVYAVASKEFEISQHWINCHRLPAFVSQRLAQKGAKDTRNICAKLSRVAPELFDLVATKMNGNKFKVYQTSTVNQVTEML